MKISNWDYVNKELDKLFLEIFKNIKVNTLDSYTKRKMIFDYLCSNINYDFSLLEKIKQNQIGQNKTPRDPYLEVESVLKYKKGICNAIAQVYKFLLEKAGIYSLCVICDDGTDVNHQLNLVYDEELDLFSFDDITSVIVNRGTTIDFFDYDMEDANKFNQGCKPIFNDKYWMYLPTDYINLIFGRKDSSYLKYDYEITDVFEIPKNIFSQKKGTKKI